MSKNDGQGESMPPASLPPETTPIDAHWDDDALDLYVPEQEARSDPFARVTSIPDAPPEEYVGRLMAEAERAERGISGSEDDPADDPSSRKTPVQYLSSPRIPVFEPAPDTVPHSLPVPSSGESDFETLSLDLDDSEFDGPHYEIEIDKPAQKPAPPAPAPVPLGHAAKLLAEARDRYAMGDFSGALVVVETLLEAEPDHAEAHKIAGSCRDVLMQMYSARLGPLNQVVTVAIPADQIRWLSLDHRAGFLLSLVDGISSIEEILDVSGMSRLDALRIMCTLLEQRVIAIEHPFR
jgi:hypothetical protein